jgi:hypothetical protein
MMNVRARTLFLLIAMIATGVFAADARADKTYSVDDDTFAAIAYSPATGKYGYSYNYGSRWAAELAAKRNCAADDACVVCWANCGFCVLALGDDPTCWGIGYAYGTGATLKEAHEMALADCQKRTSGARIAVVVLSDGQFVFDAPRGSETQVKFGE